MISSTEKQWNSSTTLYIARGIKQRADKSPLSVLDMGCGDGSVLEFLFDEGYDLYGYDFPEREESARKKLEPYFGNEFDKHIRFMHDERIIPFDDNAFDIVYANQIFEHVKFFETMMSECSRILRPNGVLLANFPLATYPIEGHLKIPFAHWLPPGNLRARYLYFFYALGLRPRLQADSAWQRAVDCDNYLKDRTYYRFMNEVQNIGEYYFEEVALETNLFLQTKLDLMSNSSNISSRLLAMLVAKFNPKVTEFLCTNFINAAFCFKNPRK